MDQIKNIKLNRKIIVLIGVIGLLLMFFGGGGGEKPSDVTEETRLEQILSHIEGAGKVKVMLSQREKKQSAFNEDNDSKYIGVIVLAEGGGKNNVKEKIIKAVNAVTGLDAHKIVVYRLEQ